MKKYLFHYYFQGSQWCCDVYANSPEEAKEKVKAMSQAIYDGEHMITIPVPVKPQSFIARLITRLLQR